MTHVETLGRDLGRVRSQPSARPMDAAVFQIVPGALEGEVRRDGGKPRAEDRKRPKARTATLKQSASMAKQHRIAMLKHRRQAEDVLGNIALRAMVAMGAQWIR